MRGTNRWRTYANLIQLGSYREANAPIECSAEDATQLMNRAAMRCAELERATLWLDRETVSYLFGPKNMFKDWDTQPESGKSPSHLTAYIWSTEHGNLVSYNIKGSLNPKGMTFNCDIKDVVKYYPKIAKLYGLMTLEQETGLGLDNETLKKYYDERLGVIKVEKFIDRKIDLADRITRMLKGSDYLGAIGAINEITKSGTWTDEQFYQNRKDVFDLVPAELKLRLYRSGKLRNRQTYFIRHCGHTVQEFLGIEV